MVGETRIRIRGTVQGVGFRPAVYRVASELGINGTVRNDGPDVIIECERGEELLDKLMDILPPLAVIDSIHSEKLKLSLDKGFKIIESSPGIGSVSIPTDTAMCDRCLEEIGLAGRRHSYPFTSCTDCGARFTLLKSLPYDRSNTSMTDFPMCPDCEKEFKNPYDRRLHHQTICCPECGPVYRLTDKEGKTISGNPIPTFARMLSEGKLGVVKSWGGMHICGTLENTERLREWYGRPQKPFAIMIRDKETVFKYGNPGENELSAITSPHRPIVLIDKKNVPESVAPGLDNVGMFLPYSGVQHLLFRHLEEDALIMTSANPPGEPMLTDDEDVMDMEADMYLLHNRKIVNRADDSVLRMFGTHTFYLRKSRGSIPSYIDSMGLNGSVIGIGAQENLTGSVSGNGRIYQTQFVGDGAGIGVTEYLESSIVKLAEMIGSEPEIIAMDMHPGYSTRKVGRNLSDKYNVPIVEIQHHWAHAASLLADNGLTGGTILTLDGTGYGTDGNAWGGEVLSTDLKDFTRDAHLENIPLLGAERAVYDLKRLKFAIDQINGKESDLFPEREASILKKLMNTSVKSSSMGRLMDTLSFVLGKCEYRTYDGEPSMKLEPLLARGSLIPGYETHIENGIIKTAHLFDKIDRNDKQEDVAYSIVYNVMKELVAVAIENADRTGNGYIGMSGGVTYNRVVSEMFDKLGSYSDHELIFHDRVPNGDGGISVGQAAIALMMIE